MFVKLNRQSWQLLSGVLLSVFLAACAVPPGSGISPVQSPNDEREYRLLTLENQLQVLLISDPESPKAAAALDVMVGSGDNPPGRGGLAHFLEHMAFKGTSKRSALDIAEQIANKEPAHSRQVLNTAKALRTDLQRRNLNGGGLRRLLGLRRTRSAHQTNCRDGMTKPRQSCELRVIQDGWAFPE